jgi:hypothetical protein
MARFLYSATAIHGAEYQNLKGDVLGYESIFKTLRVACLVRLKQKEV